MRQVPRGCSKQGEVPPFGAVEVKLATFLDAEHLLRIQSTVVALLASFAFGVYMQGIGEAGSQYIVLSWLALAFGMLNRAKFYSPIAIAVAAASLYGLGVSITVRNGALVGYSDDYGYIETALILAERTYGDLLDPFSDVIQEVWSETGGVVPHPGFFWFLGVIFKLYGDLVGTPGAALAIGVNMLLFGWSLYILAGALGRLSSNNMRVVTAGTLVVGLHPSVLIFVNYIRKDTLILWLVLLGVHLVVYKRSSLLPLIALVLLPFRVSFSFLLMTSWVPVLLAKWWRALRRLACRHREIKPSHVYSIKYLGIWMLLVIGSASYMAFHFRSDLTAYLVVEMDASVIASRAQDPGLASTFLSNPFLNIVYVLLTPFPSSTLSYYENPLVVYGTFYWVAYCVYLIGLVRKAALGRYAISAEGVFICGLFVCAGLMFILLIQVALEQDAIWMAEGRYFAIMVIFSVLLRATVEGSKFQGVLAASRA
jgi:hypothetical protein